MERPRETRTPMAQILRGLGAAGIDPDPGVSGKAAGAAAARDRASTSITSCSIRWTWQGDALGPMGTDMTG